MSVHTDAFCSVQLQLITRSGFFSKYPHVRETQSRSLLTPLEASKVHLRTLKISDRVDNDVSQIDFSLQVSNGVLFI
jgi:hypothetical protein